MQWLFRLMIVNATACMSKLIHKDRMSKMMITKTAADKMDIISEIGVHLELQLHVSQLRNCESQWTQMIFLCVRDTILWVSDAISCIGENPVICRSV